MSRPLCPAVCHDAPCCVLLLHLLLLLLTIQCLLPGARHVRRSHRSNDAVSHKSVSCALCTLCACSGKVGKVLEIKQVGDQAGRAGCQGWQAGLAGRAGRQSWQGLAGRVQLLPLPLCWRWWCCAVGLPRPASGLTGCTPLYKPSSGYTRPACTRPTADAAGGEGAAAAQRRGVQLSAQALYPAGRALAGVQGSAAGAALQCSAVQACTPVRHCFLHHQGPCAAPHWPLPNLLSTVLVAPIEAKGPINPSH